MPTCTPAALADAAKTFQGLSPGQKQAIDTYLLAVIAGGSTDPNTLALAAKDFQGIPPGMLKRVQAYLLCQIASGGGGSSQDMQVAWTPTSVKLGELVGFASHPAAPVSGVTTLTLDQVTMLDGIQLDTWPNLTSISGPNLTGINPLLASGLFGMAIYSCSALTTISFPVITAIGPSGIGLGSNHVLVTTSFPLLVTSKDGIFIDDCPLLTTFSLPSYVPGNGEEQVISNCGLNAASVNAFLHRLTLNAGYVSGNVDLSGGTNAAPTGQGIIDKGLLIGRGATVTTN